MLISLIWFDKATAAHSRIWFYHVLCKVLRRKMLGTISGLHHQSLSLNSPLLGVCKELLDHLSHGFLPLPVSLLFSTYYSWLVNLLVSTKYGSHCPFILITLFKLASCIVAAILSFKSALSSFAWWFLVSSLIGWWLKGIVWLWL
jgi:hypothetical protein